MATKQSPTAGIIAVVIFLSLYIGCKYQCNKLDEEVKQDEAAPATENDLKISAYSLSQNYIKENLKNPDEATFSPTMFEFGQNNEREVTDENNDYIVNAHVTSTNSYGGKLKVRYKCILHWKGGSKSEDYLPSKWDLIYLSLGDDVLYN